jgi:hypothetical protein
VEGAAKRLFDNLLSIEVNTLVKPGMTGRKMPVVGQALLDIFGEYDTWLCGCIGRINPLWRDFRRTDAARAYARQLRDQGKLDDSKVVLSNGFIHELPLTSLFDEAEPITDDEFHALRELAATALEMHRAMSANDLPLDPADASMLRRIMRNCDQLVAIMRNPALVGSTGEMTLSRDSPTGMKHRTQPVPFSADDILIIRKAWELGTEIIVMQTVVQIDGDAVTRLNDASASAEQQMLRNVHQHGVETALGQWNSLVGTFVSIVDKLGQYLRG